MTSILKKAILLSICCLILCSAVSCSGGISGSEAKETVANFLEAVENGDFEKAEELLHPDRPVHLEKFFDNVESKEGLDFQAGIEIEKYTGFSSSYYDSTVDGSTYGLTMKATVGGKNTTIFVELVKNDNGYGIYNFEIDT